MARSAIQPSSDKSMTLLSRLLLSTQNDNGFHSSTKTELKRDIQSLSQNEFDDLVELAQPNHVVIRGLEVLFNLMCEEQDTARAMWADSALEQERRRIETALGFLHEICEAFEVSGYDVMVIKSLDHWSDLGSDLDLYTNANPEDVQKLMQARFGANLAARSWGDRLARKWNFLLSGLPESVEIHMGRLGQTGEQVEFASRLMARSRTIQVGDYAFRVPSKSDRIIISTMQRMYRHFYFRLCDVIDTATLIETEGVDYEDLRSSASAAQIWEGVAAYLVIVSDYVKKFRGTGLQLPQFVRSASQFSGNEIRYGRSFLRVPIMPQSVRLYASQLAGVLARGELHSGARLSLLPWLATAAVVGQKISGSDKGIW